MSTTAVSGTSTWWKTPTSTDTATSATGTNNLSDFDTFIKLLATELQNQDPSDPVSNTEYVSQMAQLNSLSQLQTISSTMANSSAYNLIGKEVTYQATDSTTGNTNTASGTVQAVVIKDNTAYIKVDGKTVSLASVQQVTDSTVSSTSSTVAS